MRSGDHWDSRDEDVTLERRKIEDLGETSVQMVGLKQDDEMVTFF